MKEYVSKNIRNVVLLGHGGSGKTSFVEAALLNTGVTTRLGKVEEGNTCSDYDKIEIEKGFSINQTIVPIEYKGTKINLIDTPGFFDFIQEPIYALSTGAIALILVDASAGVQVGTEKAFELAKQYNVPTFFIITKVDKDNLDIDAVVADIREHFGNSCTTDTDVDALNEAVAMSDEALLTKFLDGESFTEEEFNHGLWTGIASGDVKPIIRVSSITGEGVDEILGCFAKYIPEAKEQSPVMAKDMDGNPIELVADPDGETVLYVFKTLLDPFLGKISYAKIMSGSLKPGDELFNPSTSKSEKLASMFFVQGKNQEPASLVQAGDLIALGKLQDTKTGDTLCQKSHPLRVNSPSIPAACYFIAIEPKDESDDEKMTQGLKKLMEEDSSLELKRNPETHQTLLGGLGDMQLNIVLAKLLDRYKVKTNIVPIKVAYRETIKGSSDVQGKHKKQSGGAGQYGDVHIRFSRGESDGLEFSEELFGGSVPKNYVPAVEKGLLECMEAGPLAGCKVQNIKAVLYDGSYHDVDSNEVSFKIAASLAFKKGIAEADPCILEPIMKLDIDVPSEYVGDVMGDLPNRRGVVLGMDQSDKGQLLHAEAPESELFDYAISLRSMTQARASFTMEFSRYQELPKALADKIIAEHASVSSAE